MTTDVFVFYGVWVPSNRYRHFLSEEAALIRTAKELNRQFDDNPVSYLYIGPYDADELFLTAGPVHQLDGLSPVDLSAMIECHGGSDAARARYRDVLDYWTVLAGYVEPTPLDPARMWAVVDVG